MKRKAKTKKAAKRKSAKRRPAFRVGEEKGQLIVKRLQWRVHDPLFFAGVGLALLDSFLRCDPPSAGALRSRLALKSATASAKILRLNADEGALRDLRFAMDDDPGPAARARRSRFI